MNKQIKVICINNNNNKFEIGKEYNAIEERIEFINNDFINVYRILDKPFNGSYHKDIFMPKLEYKYYIREKKLNRIMKQCVCPICGSYNVRSGKEYYQCLDCGYIWSKY